MILDGDSGQLFCHTSWCAAAGMPESVWRAEQRRTGQHFAESTPAGLPRPRIDGRPVPWITPVSGQFVWWRQIHGDRVRACQEQWLCQFCGLKLGREAHVVVDVDGSVVTDAALHEDCLVIALRQCPALRAGTTTGHEYTTALVTADSILADYNAYRPGVELVERQLWSLRPQCHQHAAPHPMESQ